MKPFDRFAHEGVREHLQAIHDHFAPRKGFEVGSSGDGEITVRGGQYTAYVRRYRGSDSWRVAICRGSDQIELKKLGSTTPPIEYLEDIFSAPERERNTSMPILQRPAARIAQGNLTLFATSLRVRDLRQPNFYSIDTLDPHEGTGYQRILNEARAKRLAEYLLEGQKAFEAFLPTSIFLATEKSLRFDDDTNLVHINHHEAGPFNVVDGQHRIRGLVLAAERDSELDNFEIPVNIAVNLSPVAQMAHFLIVNTTQRSVDKAIEQQIVARLSEMVDFEQTPVLPRWIQRQVDKGEDQRALAIAQHLNEEQTSAWFSKIRMANDANANEATVNQKSFVTSLKQNVLTPNNPISGWDTDKQKKVLNNYWRAIRNLLVEDADESTVLFKTNGVQLFHIASPAVFVHLANQRNFTTETIEGLLRRAFEHLPSEYIGMSSPAFWIRGSTASGLNQGAIRKYATALATAVHARPDFADGGITF